MNKDYVILTQETYNALLSYLGKKPLADSLQVFSLVTKDKTILATEFTVEPIRDCEPCLPPEDDAPNTTSNEN